MNPGSIAREGFLTSVLSIAVSGYLGGSGVDGNLTTTMDSFAPSFIGAVVNPSDGSLSVVMDGFVPSFIGAHVAPPLIAIDAVPTDNYEICAVSGFRALPGTLVYDDYTREKVLPEFADRGDFNHRKFMSTDTKKGALRPEQDDTFIDTPVDPDDF